MKYVSTAVLGWRVFLVGLLLTWALSGAARAAGSGEALYRFAPVPGWVHVATPEYGAPVPASGVADGAWDLLLDRQTNLNPDGDDFYHHQATLVTNASGVDERSQIDVEVDPSYQTLTLHTLRVVRQGRVIDQKPRARVTALPRETELRDRIYNGTYNINILLFDVRVGDVVEYEYTLHSVEHVFPGVFSERVNIGWSVPMHWQRVRILAPVSQSLFYRTEDGSTPSATVHDGMRELTWEWHDPAPIPGDDDRPKWYSTWPHLEVSSLHSWSEVAQREAPHYEVHPVGSAALAQVVSDIRQAGGTPAEQALHALQFVQEQIRYVSISIGPGGFVPNPPETPLERRCGDCKDKSLLLATLLHELGIQARVALVNSRRGRVLSSSLPTPYAFDHAIVRMQLDNQTYWLDGTDDKQYSPLSTAAPADFERALVVDRATAELEVIPRPAAGASSKTSTVSVDLSAGADKPARLNISTFYQGELADRTRQELADETPAKRQSDYIKYIVRYYPGAKTAASIEIHDDVVHDVVEVREFYTIEKPFKNSNGRRQLFLQADELYRFLGELDSTVRKAPLAIAYPIDVRQTVRASLPEKMSIRNETVRVENPAFRYESVVSYSESATTPQLTLDYYYKSLADSVDVADLPQYQADRKRAYDDLGYYVRPQFTTATFEVAKLGKVATVVRWTTVIAILLAAWLALRHFIRWDPSPPRSEPDWPVGIRGWLRVMAFDVVVTPLSTCFSEYAFDLSALDVAHWSRLYEIVPAPWKGSAPYILLLLQTWGIFIVVAEYVLAWLFFTRRTSAPRAFIVIHWMAFFYGGLLDSIPAGFHLIASPNGVRLTFALLLTVAVNGAFTMYFLTSRRVKATFVRRCAQGRARDSMIASTT